MGNFKTKLKDGEKSGIYEIHCVAYCNKKIRDWPNQKNFKFCSNNVKPVKYLI